MLFHDPLKAVFPALLLAAPGAALIFLALGAGSERADFTFVNQCEISSLDPAVSTTIPEGRIIMALFEGLATPDPKTLAPLPGAASSWDVSADGLEYTFHIRPDLKWSDGSPLTARDFLYSWRRFLARETAAPYAFLLFRVEGARKYYGDASPDKSETCRELGLAAPDDHTFIVRLESPCPFFLNLAAFYPLYPVPRRCIEFHGPGRWLKPENIISNGPFRVRERRLKDRIRLEKNPFYWDEKNVSLRTIDALALDSPVTALNLYLTGDVDWINVVPPIAIPALKNRPGFSASPNLGTNFLRFNTKKKPFDDPKVRRAIHLAVNKVELVEGVLKGGQIPASSFVPPGIPGYIPPSVKIFDPARARSLLAAAGYPGGRNFPDIELLYSTGETGRNLAEVIALQLKRNLKIRIHPSGLERQVYYLSQRTLDYDICLCSWLGDYLDASSFLDVFGSESGNNRTGWRNDSYDALLRRAAVELDGKKRAGLLRRAEEILLDAAPIAVLYYRSTTNMIDPAWEGYENNILDIHPLKYLRRRRP